jgi:hypothetical protein
LKEVVVVAIDQRDAHVGTAERTRGVETSETAPDNDHVRNRHRR